MMLLFPATRVRSRRSVATQSDGRNRAGRIISSLFAVVSLNSSVFSVDTLRCLL